jgi:hypothetical protein
LVLLDQARLFSASTGRKPSRNDQQEAWKNQQKWRNILKGAGGKNDKRGAGGGRAGKDWAVQDVVYSDLDRGEDQLSEFWWLRVDVI